MSDDQELLDGENGFLLAPHIDKGTSVTLVVRSVSFFRHHRLLVWIANFPRAVGGQREALSEGVTVELTICLCIRLTDGG